MGLGQRQKYNFEDELHFYALIMESQCQKVKYSCIVYRWTRKIIMTSMLHMDHSCHIEKSGYVSIVWIKGINGTGTGRSVQL